MPAYTPVMPVSFVWTRGTDKITLLLTVIQDKITLLMTVIQGKADTEMFQLKKASIGLSCELLPGPRSCKYFIKGSNR